jgi:cytochrome b subunit of formate dehydrogenase
MVTGFSLMFPYSVWTIIIIRFFGGFYLRGVIHRIAAVVFVGLSIYHLGFLLFTPRGRKETKELLPAKKDFSDFFQMLKYFAGWEKERPKFGRFSYVEKSEYWALVWGTLIMTITGILLWAETKTIGLFTKLGFDLAKVIHGYEALLAALALLVWHFYHVHFNPEDFPFKNKIWLDGKISREKMAKEHPLELEVTN